MTNTIVDIKTEKLLPNPYQPRKKFNSDELLSLADSIKSNGVLQPLLVRRLNETDYYEIVAGERRLRASILANTQTVPCIILDCNYEDSALISILENIQRSDLSFFEEAQSIAYLKNHFSLTQEEIGRRLGCSQSALSNKTRLLKLPPDVRAFIEQEHLTERHARALLKIQDNATLWKVLHTIRDKQLNVEQTESLIDRLYNCDEKGKPKRILILKDIRIFINTVNRALDTMKASGIDAKSNKYETDEYIEFSVRVNKENAKHFNSA